MIKACDRQLRVSFGGIIGLDFASVFAISDRMGARGDLLADVLPDVERVIVWAYQKDGD